MKPCAQLAAKSHAHEDAQRVRSRDKTWTAALILVASLLAAGWGRPADAADVYLGPRAGGLIPFSKASLTYEVGLELGAQLALDGLLGAMIEVSYRRPTRSITVSDAHVSGGSYSAKIADPEIAVFLGPRAMIDLGGLVVPFAALGLGVHFVRSEVSGGLSTAAFEDISEHSTRFGLGARAGAGVHVWEGLAAASLALDLAGLDHRLSGGASLSSISLAVSYLFEF
jgi:hypothetical protein